MPLPEIAIIAFTQAATAVAQQLISDAFTSKRTTISIQEGFALLRQQILSDFERILDYKLLEMKMATTQSNLVKAVDCFTDYCATPIRKNLLSRAEEYARAVYAEVLVLSGKVGSLLPPDESAFFCPSKISYWEYRPVKNGRSYSTHFDKRYKKTGHSLYEVTGAAIAWCFTKESFIKLTMALAALELSILIASTTCPEDLLVYKFYMDKIRSRAAFYHDTIVNQINPYLEHCHRLGIRDDSNQSILLHDARCALGMPHTDLYASTGKFIERLARLGGEACSSRLKARRYNYPPETIFGWDTIGDQPDFDTLEAYFYKDKHWRQALMPLKIKVLPDVLSKALKTSFFLPPIYKPLSVEQKRKLLHFASQFFQSEEEHPKELFSQFIKIFVISLIRGGVSEGVSKLIAESSDTVSDDTYTKVEISVQVTDALPPMSEIKLESEPTKPKIEIKKIFVDELVSHVVDSVVKCRKENTAREERKILTDILKNQLVSELKFGAGDALTKQIEQRARSRKRSIHKSATQSLRKETASVKLSKKEIRLNRQKAWQHYLQSSKRKGRIYGTALGTLIEACYQGVEARGDLKQTTVEFGKSIAEDAIVKAVARAVSVFAVPAGRFISLNGSAILTALQASDLGTDDTPLSTSKVSSISASPVSLTSKL